MKNFLKNHLLLIILLGLSIVVHFAFLSYPAEVVFDEVHFGKFVSAYFTHQYYFDIHPPLGKLMIAGFAKFFGFQGNFDFAQIGEVFNAQILFVLRFPPALFGTLFVLLIFKLGQAVGLSKKMAFLASFLVLFENSILVESKFILVDIFLIFFEVLTLCFFFLWQRQKSFNAKWFGYLFLTAIFFGLTISIKWTGVATIGIIGIVLFARIFSKKLRGYLEDPISVIPAKAGIQTPNPEPGSRVKPGMTKRIMEAILSFLIILFIGFIIYLIPFYLHFQLLQKSGPGDAFMSQPFQQELRYGRENTYQPLNFWQKFIELNKTMYTANASISSQHPFGSKWYSWPINSRPVYYWNQENINGLPDWEAKIYFSGNPALWWLATFAVILIIFRIFTKNGRRQLSPIYYILLLGYFANLLPFIFITRVAFLYHYLPSSFYAILILSLLLANFWPQEKKIFLSILILIAFGFILLSPLSYGWPMPPAIDNIETTVIGFFH